MKTTLLIIVFTFSLLSCTGNKGESSGKEGSDSQVSAMEQSASYDQSTVDASATPGGGQIINDTVTDVYVPDNGHAIFYDTENEEGLILIEDENHLFTILETTDDNSWVIAEKAPSEVGIGRIETEYLLFFTPEARQVDIESLNPSLTGQGMHFGRAFGEPQLIAYLKESFIPVPLPFESLPEGSMPGIPEPADEEDPPATTGNEAVILELMLGEEEHRLGQGVVYKQLRKEGSIYSIDAMPSFAACDSLLYIIDAINFRVLIYDMAGRPAGRISYPEEKEGIPVVMEDMVLEFLN